MMTVREVSRRTGVSVRALQYYDRIGLLPPSSRTEAGYRLYDDGALRTLRQILLFRELQFPLSDIRRILRSPGFSRQRALAQQIRLLEMKRDRLDAIIRLAREIETTGGDTMDFSAFDTKKIEEYEARAKASWGETREYREYERKAQGRTREEEAALGARMMEIFARLGRAKDLDPASETAQALVRELQAFITAHYYACSGEVLAGLGQMYAAGGEMTENIDRAGGPGTAAFAAEAIRAHCAG